MALSSALLVFPLIALDGLPVAAAVLVFIAIVVTSALVTFVMKAVDRDSIISLRRMFGLTFAANILWAIPATSGSLVSWLTHNNQHSLNGFVLGAFLAWSLELLVINGGFIYSTTKSVCIAAVQPLSTLLLASVFLLKANTAVIYSTILGLVVLSITATFLVKFKTFRTESARINSLEILQSFLKTWVSHKASSLENYFTMYSQGEPVVTRVVLASAANQAALVLPGVHPGPFFPVGSYNISELIFHELRRSGMTPMVLHGVGGHERNLPTNELARQYAATIANAVGSQGADHPVQTMRGPIRVEAGPTTITTLGFGNHIVAFLSSAPYNTDDLPPGVIDQAISAAKEMDIELMLVDAHNSIGGKDCEQPQVDWRKVFQDNSQSPEEEFDLGVAHSSELRFDHGSDISDGGVAALVFRKHRSTYALITSDSNNAVIGLRQLVADELEKEGVVLIELCTSDTHNSAARSLTSRGYHALGEDSDRRVLAATIKKLEKMAEGRLSHGSISTVTSNTTLPLIGDKSLNDFAALTHESLRFARRYAAAALTSTLVICILALFL